MIRPWTQQDLPSLLVIEKLTQLAPWSKETFEKCFDAHYLGWIIEENNQIIGFIIMTLFLSESHILNICIHPDFQNQGFGRQLFAWALQSAQDQGAEIAYLEVRRSNIHAIHMYQKMDFIQIGERKNYYPAPTPTGQEDALVFAKDLRVNPRAAN